jgi:predicted metalloprotease
MSFEDHAELTRSFYKQLAKRYEQKGEFADTYQLGYLQGMLQSIWLVLELSDEQKKLFQEYINLHINAN